MRVLLAVSGGIDSMYMAERAPELFPGAGFAVAHCNFSLRGPESDGDEEFVRNWCTEHGVPCFVKRFDTNDYAASHSISTEMAARDLRYAWFTELCSSEGFDALAVAHNANDNAETLILNLLRGTGSKGLRGMGERKLGAARLLRPLLGTTRQEIYAWMKEHGKLWREDSSNAANIFKRNKIRNEVFPVFSEINPSFLKTIADDIRHFTQVDDIAEDYFQDVAMTAFVAGSTDSISIPSLKSLKHWDYILYRLLSPYGFDGAVIDSLTELLRSGNGTLSGKTFEAPEWKVVTASDRLIIIPADGRDAAPDRVQIAAPGEFTAGGKKLTVNVFERPEGMRLQQPSGTLIADADRLPFPLEIRKWNAGDWMKPLGLGGSKKISDMFVDLKWSLPRKEEAMVLVHPDGRDGHVGALLCERIDDSLKVKDGTRRILQISLD